MKQLPDSELQSIRTMFSQGTRVSEILRIILEQHKGFGPADLMNSLMDAFGIEFSDVDYIGGWWKDGYSELSDEDIDRFITPHIKKAHNRGMWKD